MSLTFLILLLDALEIGYHTFATIMFALTILLPCQPGLISSIACSNDHIFYTGNCLRLIFAALEFFILMQVTVRATFYVVLVLLTDFIFLWIECGIFISNNVSSKIYQIEYRKVQVLEKVLNACTRKSIFLKTAFLMPTFQMFMSFVTIILYHSENQSFMSVAFLWVYFLTLSVTLLIFSAAAQIYRMSENWVGSCKFGKRKSWERKFRKSLIPLRLQFGNNFVEVLTPLVVQEFCIRQTISFLMITK